MAERVSDEQLQGLQAMTLPPTMVRDIILDLLAARAEIERLAELVGAVKRVCLYVANRIGQTKLSTEALRQALAIAAEHGDANEWIAELELLLALRALDAKGGK